MPIRYHIIIFIMSITMQTIQKLKLFWISTGTNLIIKSVSIISFLNLKYVFHLHKLCFCIRDRSQNSMGVLQIVHHDNTYTHLIQMYLNSDKEKEFYLPFFSVESKISFTTFQRYLIRSVDIAISLRYNSR